MATLFNTIDVGPIAEVEVGMPVLDASGAIIGRVEQINMSDPEAETTEGNRFLPIGGLMRVWVRAFNDKNESLEPRVREPLRTRLMRIGYLKLAGP